MAATCPRRMTEFGPWETEEGLDGWATRDGAKRCTFCGSLDPAEFMRQVEAGEKLVPCDKNYKAYVGVSDRKFYYQHLSNPQKKRLVELLNEGKIQFGFPGHFYVLPFFVEPVEEKAS